MKRAVEFETAIEKKNQEGIGDLKEKLSSVIDAAYANIKGSSSSQLTIFFPVSIEDELKLGLYEKEITEFLATHGWKMEKKGNAFFIVPIN